MFFCVLKNFINFLQRFFIVTFLATRIGSSSKFFLLPPPPVPLFLFFTTSAKQIPDQSFLSANPSANGLRFSVFLHHATPTPSASASAYLQRVGGVQRGFCATLHGNGSPEPGGFFAVVISPRFIGVYFCENSIYLQLISRPIARGAVPPSPTSPPKSSSRPRLLKKEKGTLIIF